VYSELLRGKKRKICGSSYEMLLYGAWTDRFLKFLAQPVKH